MSMTAFREDYDLSEDIQMCNKVAVYGTLRKGFGNNRLLGDSRFLGEGLSEFEATMYSNGGFPILSLNEESSKVVVELFVVDDTATLEDLDRLEGYPYWYNRSICEFNVNGELVKAWIYHQENITGLDIVESGDWKEFKGMK